MNQPLSTELRSLLASFTNINEKEEGEALMTKSRYKNKSEKTS